MSFMPQLLQNCIPGGLRAPQRGQTEEGACAVMKVNLAPQLVQNCIPQVGTPQ